MGGTIDFFPNYGTRFRQLDITTIAGIVGSSGVNLYLLGKQRLAFVDSVFWFHEASTDEVESIWTWLAKYFGVHVPINELPGTNIGLYGDLERYRLNLEHWLIGFTSEQSGVPGSTLFNLMTSNARISAGMAREYGLVHTIVDNDAIDSLELAFC